MQANGVRALAVALTLTALSSITPYSAVSAQQPQPSAAAAPTMEQTIAFINEA